MDRKNIIKDYEQAKQIYAELNIHTDSILEKMKEIPLSIHCWQGDDVEGFENKGQNIKDAGLSLTGGALGKPRNIDEFRMDFEFLLSLVPENNKINLHAIYGDFDDPPPDRDQLDFSFYKSWVDWAKERNLGMDFNPTCFGHTNASAGLTLSSSNKDVRQFWIEHVSRTRQIAFEIGQALNKTCIHNIWIPDGKREFPYNPSILRGNLKDSLDKIFEKEYPRKFMADSLEGKLFGAGMESFTSGSYDFYLGYAIQNKKFLTLDTGHFHPTESVGDKISAIAPFLDGIFLHLSRGVRWDSDNVLLYNDELVEFAARVIRDGLLDKVFFGLDFFEGSINRLGAWSIGVRATRKAILNALLVPPAMDIYEGFELMAFMENLKTMPFSYVWDMFCQTQNIPLDRELFQCIKHYEEKVLKNRE